MEKLVSTFKLVSIFYYFLQQVNVRIGLVVTNLLVYNGVAIMSSCLLCVFLISCSLGFPKIISTNMLVWIKQINEKNEIKF